MIEYKLNALLSLEDSRDYKLLNAALYWQDPNWQGVLRPMRMAYCDKDVIRFETDTHWAWNMLVEGSCTYNAQ